MSSRINQIVLKVAERCNLNCTYCYVYNHVDKSYLQRPKFMSAAIYEHVLQRMREHCDRHLHRMSISFHGGEPTLVGAQQFDRFAGRAREVLGRRLDGISIQTNATLIDYDWAEAFARHKVQIGVSLDGPAAVHDALRVDGRGRGSHEAVLRGIAILQNAGLELFILTVISPGQSGLDIYRYLRDLGIRAMDFLLPDVSHDSKAQWYGAFGPTPIADYLLPIFDTWMEEDNPDVTIRLFDDLLRLLMGGRGQTDALGNASMGYLVVETDGAIEALDSLRVCEGSLQRSGLNVRTQGFDDLDQGSPLVRQFIAETMPLAPVCRRCPERRVCGGGHLPHRHARANGFDNPSVWCADLLKLIRHARRVVASRRAA